MRPEEGLGKSDDLETGSLFESISIGLASKNSN